MPEVSSKQNTQATSDKSQLSRPWREYRLRIQWDSMGYLQNLGKIALPIPGFVLTFYLIHFAIESFSLRKAHPTGLDFVIGLLALWACAGIAYSLCLLIYRFQKHLDHLRAPPNTVSIRSPATHCRSPRWPPRLPHRYLEFLLCGRHNITTTLVKRLPQIPGSNLFLLFDARHGLGPPVISTDVSFEPICFGKDRDRLAWLYAHHLNAQGWRAADVAGLTGDYLDALQSEAVSNGATNTSHDQQHRKEGNRVLNPWLRIAAIAVPVLSAFTRGDIAQLIMIGIFWAVILGWLFYERTRHRQSGNLGGPDLWLYPGGLALTKTSGLAKRLVIEPITLANNNIAVIAPSNRMVASVNGKGRLILNDDAHVTLSALVSHAPPPHPAQLQALLEPSTDKSI